MCSRYSSERSEGRSGFVSATRNSKFHGLSEDCIEPSGGGTESGEAVSDSVFFGLGEGAFGEKNMRNVSERVPESGMVTLAENPVYGAVDSLPETDQGDRSHKRSMSDVCASTLAGRRKSDGGKRIFVTFNPEVTLRGQAQ